MPNPEQEEIQAERLDSTCFGIESDGKIDYNLYYIQSEADKLATEQECVRFLHSIDYHEAIRNLLINYLDNSTEDILAIDLLKEIITNPAKFCRDILFSVTDESPCIDDEEKIELLKKDAEKNDLNVIRDFNKYCLTQSYDDNYPLHNFSNVERKQND